MPAASVLAKEQYGWDCLKSNGSVFWFKGYLYGTEPSALFQKLNEALAAWQPDRLRDELRAIHGHFALILQTAERTLAAVDQVRSIPLFICNRCGDRDAGVASHAPSLAREMHQAPLDEDAARELAMAGYTIGNATLVQGLRQLGPGEFGVSDNGTDWVEDRYQRYEPWRVVNKDEAELEDKLGDVTLSIIRKMADSANGRMIVIPLSAGLDSRLIASALRHIGYDNVRCFSYGIAGNYETQASQQIADALGFRWKYWRYWPREQAAFFKGDLHARYLDYCDSLCSVPFIQDLAAIDGLKRDGFIPDDAVLVNGNSGDFISGNHIPAYLRGVRREPGSESSRRPEILRALVTKHFRLWQALGTTENDAAVSASFGRLMDVQALTLGAPETDHGIYEFLEFYTRQTRYVITGERIYEFLGHDWRLPLWDNEYLDFWQGISVSMKAGQKLYRQMLEQRNWGGVWGANWRFRHRVNPAWMRWLVRPPLKALHAPLGAERWHRFEKRYLNYWMDLWAAVSVVSPMTTLRDGRGARSFVSWHTEAYLASKGLGYDGRPASDAFVP
ncbi:MAG: hypothetical protein GKS00_02985 [Alphaproteobacteria bacterium]|nr:hypothetical protein [Alphaproteobacteria bacterium]